MFPFAFVKEIAAFRGDKIFWKKEAWHIALKELEAEGRKMGHKSQRKAAAKLAA